MHKYIKLATPFLTVLKIQIPKLFTFGFFSTSTSYSGKILNVPILFIITYLRSFVLSINESSLGTLGGLRELSLPIGPFLGITYKTSQKLSDRKSLLDSHSVPTESRFGDCIAEN